MASLRAGSDGRPPLAGRPVLPARGWLVGIAAAGLVAAFAARGAFFGERGAAAIRRAMRAHDWPAALASIDSVGERRDGAAEAAFLAGRVYRRQDLLAASERAFAAAESAGWDARAVARQRMLNVVQSGRIRAVEEQVRRMLDGPVDDLFAEECYEALTKGYVAAYRIGDALECVTWWLEWQPDNALALVWHGRVLERLERLGAALDSYRRAIVLDPSCREASLAVARLSLENARSEEAEAMYASLAHRDADDADALIGLAECRMHRGDHEAAGPPLVDCLCLDLPGDTAARALAALGRINLEREDPEAAVPLLAAAIDRDPTQATTHLDYASALEGLGRSDGSLRHREIGRRLADARVRLTAVTRQAIGRPDDPDLRVEAGRILLELGFVDEGRQWLETALAIDPAHEPARTALEASTAPAASGEHSGASAPSS